MNDKYFLDTNILVYSFDQAHPLQRRQARKLIKQALTKQSGCISFQVIQEFLNVATRKFRKPLAMKDCQTFLNTVLEPLCEVYSSIGLYFRSLEIMDRWKYGFDDSIIIAAALQAECTILYSEDLQHGQLIQNLEILNPFI